MATLTLPALYLPPISWFHFFLNDENEIHIEQFENLPKQTLRNRCHIFGANGKLNLTIPLKKNGKRAMKDIEISYNENWQKLHWKSIKNVYQSAPYFEYYEDQLKTIYEGNVSSLLAFNLKAISIILKLLKTEKAYSLTEQYEATPQGKDLRNAFEAKKDSIFPGKPYYQVFSDKMGFLADLSILDLICNLGPETQGYLKSLKIGEI